jgi:hypothetical protein
MELRITFSKIAEYRTKEELKLFTDITLRHHGFDFNREILSWMDYLNNEVVFTQEEE